MSVQMPGIQLADGRIVPAPCGADGLPDWGAVEPVYGSPIAAETSPAPTRVVPRDEFVRRIGLEPLTQIVAAAQTDPALGALVVRVQTAGDTIDLDDPDVIAGLGLLVQRGILTAADAAAVRA